MDVRNMTSGISPQIWPSLPPSLIDHGEKVSRLIYDTADEGGLSARAFAVFKKDWDRFVKFLNKTPQPPLSPQEAIMDLKDFVDYMKKYGDMVKIASTNSNMKQIIEDCEKKADEYSMAEYTKYTGKAPRSRSEYEASYLLNLAGFITHDTRIPDDYCFLRFPSEELQHSVSVADLTFNEIISTKDESGIPDMTLCTLTKDWNRFNARAYGEKQEPLALEEAEKDLTTFISYAIGPGRKILIDNTTLGEIVETDIFRANKLTKEKMNQSVNLVTLAHYIAQNERISDANCIWRLPAIEYLRSLAAKRMNQ